MKYPEHKKLDLPAIDQEILEKWQQEKVFEASITTRAGHPVFNL
jgi:isoleucyl-tRNA synthetase